jgi:glycosyltransferase A (GT-A) superfamily protein (DUF2064 family)
MIGSRRTTETAGIDTVIVIAKRPVPGRVKTRLVPPLTPQQAADVAGAALTDTLDTLAGLPVRRHLLAFDGDPSGWAPRPWRTCPQRSGGLDSRLTGAFGRVRRGPALLVGMDTPQLRIEQLARFDTSRYDACLGLATDGGYWAIGLRDPRQAADAILGVPMSTSDTGAEQLRRLQRLGLRVQLLDELTDVDTIDNALAVAALTPGSRFARAVQRATSAATTGSATLTAVVS